MIARFYQSFEPVSQPARTLKQHSWQLIEHKPLFPRPERLRHVVVLSSQWIALKIVFQFRQ